MSIALKLSCGDKVQMDFVPMQQYPDDINFVWCPSCRKRPDKPSTGLDAFQIPLAWCEIVGVYPVQTGLPQVLPSEVLRVQPTVSRRWPNRVRPFPYTRGRTGEGRVR